MFNKKVVNVIALDGIIHYRGKKNLSLKNLQTNIDKAFEGKKVKAVVLLVNSPGGVASQSEIIANYIKNKSKEKNIPVISFIEDMAASGGYFLAVAGEEVYSLAQSAIIGSIGVIYSGFGLDEFINRHGIKRRIFTAGESKSVLDTFSPEKPEDVAILKNLLEETHEHFKNFVKQNRKNLTMPESELFSGKFWLASTAVKFGLIDGIVSDYKAFLQSRFGKKVKINLPKVKKGFLSSLFNLKLEINEDIVNNIKQELELNNLHTINYK